MLDLIAISNGYVVIDHALLRKLDTNQFGEIYRAVLDERDWRDDQMLKDLSPPNDEELYLYRSGKRIEAVKMLRSRLVAKGELPDTNSLWLVKRLLELHDKNQPAIRVIPYMEKMI